VAQARDDALQAALHADRARVAIDMNDHVICQLLGIGLELASLDGYSDLPPAVQQRVERVADTLDQTIYGLRTALFSNPIGFPEVMAIPSQPRVSRAP